MEVVKMTKKLKKSDSENVIEEVVSDAEVYELLAGYTDKEGNLHKEFEVTEMTGEDEEEISKPEIRNNGAKVIRVILERCCKRIGTFTRRSLGSQKWRELIQSLTVGDQDFIMMKIRTLSVGTELEGNNECPKCGAKLNVIVDTDELEIVHFSGDLEFEFSLPRGYKDPKGIVHRNGKIRIPTGLDRELLDPVVRKNIGEGNTLMITRCIVEFDGVHVTNDVVRKMSIKDREYLLKLIQEHMFGINFVTDVTCSECGAEFKSTFNVSNFA
jgi:uncharacterized protein (UPF0212 family)